MMRRLLVRMLVAVFVGVWFLSAPYPEVTSSTMPAAGDGATLPARSPRLSLAAPDLSSASEVLTYLGEPPASEPAASTAPPEPASSAPAVATWQAIFTEWAARLPGHYSVKETGAWGNTVLDLTETVYIAPRTPARYLAAVMMHESVHVWQIRVFGGTRKAIEAGLSAFGGMEVNADCGALLMGANYTNYVKGRCTAEQSRAATAVMQGRKP